MLLIIKEYSHEIDEFINGQIDQETSRISQNNLESIQRDIEQVSS